MTSPKGVTARDQGGNGRKAKRCETFNARASSGDVRRSRDPQSLETACPGSNGEVRQASTTKEMIFGVRDLIYQIARSPCSTPETSSTREPRKAVRVRARAFPHT